MNVLKHIVFLGCAEVCISISYLIQIMLMICTNWPEILKFPVPVHIVFTLYMLICIEIIKSRPMNIKMNT